MVTLFKAPCLTLSYFVLQIDHHGDITLVMQEACQAAVNKISEKVRYIALPAHANGHVMHSVYLGFTALEAVATATITV